MARWTREELLLALGLYFETPFGRQHKSYPPIVDLAGVIGRTPSAVAMKLNNFTSLDPSEAERGISGLTSASNLDRNIWDEFRNNRESLVDLIERQRESQIEPNEEEAGEEYPLDFPAPEGPTTREVISTQRRHQRFFRRVVLGSYGQRCCVIGLPVPTLLRASHIVPWKDSVEHRLNPRNGLCLSATFDTAFDEGLISFDAEYRLLIGAAIRECGADDEVKSVFLAREDQALHLPEKNLPDPELIRWHSENIFNRR